MTALLLSAGTFQMAWYVSLLLAAIAATTIYGTLLAARQARSMWRAGARALAATVVTAAGVAVLLFASMLAQVIVRLVPSAVGGS